MPRVCTDTEAGLCSMRAPGCRATIASASAVACASSVDCCGLSSGSSPSSSRLECGAVAADEDERLVGPDPGEPAQGVDVAAGDQGHRDARQRRGRPQRLHAAVGGAGGRAGR